MALARILSCVCDTVAFDVPRSLELVASLESSGFQAGPMKETLFRIKTATAPISRSFHDRIVVICRQGVEVALCERRTIIVDGVGL